MARVRVSTTVDQELLSSARNMRAGLADSALLDEALSALLVRHSTAEIDAAYAAYDEHPIDEPDEWGDPAAFRAAVAASYAASGLVESMSVGVAAAGQGRVRVAIRAVTTRACDQVVRTGSSTGSASTCSASSA